ncbi:asparagine synthetase B family protein [Oceanirhabdus sp. W0125-5]|uniref:asparagine synthetase B family protein n=1 Tax=Oceanirhabdus sp. W0125-5 TaxID=2999116 RepID=UPI0022F338E8|nr:asparagine synthetase B family protein [Oceanirhabdus sp. W0125-5]WBW99440.1 hypothetical protein OW730_12045 [Oceanirhabdus sp. W0125-5]
MIQCKFNNLVVKDNIQYAFKGYLYYNNCYYENQNIESLILNMNLKNIKSEIVEFNGNFFTYYENEEYVWAAVDKVRSMPVFYSYNGSDLYISDDVYWIEEKIEKCEIDNNCVSEFLCSGLVSGRNTLYKEIKQIEAGQYILFCKKTGEIKRKQYYRYVHNNYFQCNYEQIDEIFFDVLNDVFKRLIKSVNGRTLYVPLSSGLDSRLIVLMLKKLGYDKVVTYSYGKKNNFESNLSKKISDKLGYEWFFVEYSNSLWKEWYASEEYKRYCKLAHSFVSTPHFQDWPAVWMLKKQKLISEDAVFVPGHTGDFLAGSFLPYKFCDSTKEVENECIIKPILDRHYSFRGHLKKSDKKYEDFKHKILENVKDLFDGTLNGASNAVECWVWKERQAKFITNSLRVYEFWGYDWRIPFWDSCMLEFFQRLKLEDRYLKRYYKRFVLKLSREKLGEVFAKEEDTNKSLKSIDIKDLLRDTNMIQIARDLNAMKKRVLYKKEYENQPLYMYGIMSLDEFKSRYTGWQGINSFIAEDVYDLVKSNDYNS